MFCTITLFRVYIDDADETVQNDQNEIECDNNTIADCDTNVVKTNQENSNKV